MKRVLVKSLLLSVVVSSLVYLPYLPNVSRLKNRNPQTSALLDYETRRTEKKIAGTAAADLGAYGLISDHLKKAVLLSKDASFFSLNGVDITELKEAFKGI